MKNRLIVSMAYLMCFLLVGPGAPWAQGQGGFTTVVSPGGQERQQRAVDYGQSVSGGQSDTQKAAANDKELADRWLLAVGIRNFSDTRIPRLRFTADDAASMADYFIKDGTPQSQVVLLLDENATRENILRTLNEFKTRISPQGSFFFFFSSHGAGDQDGKTYFIAFDTIRDELSQTGLPMQQIRDVIQEFSCKNVVMMVDTCHSGGTKALGLQNEKEFETLVRAADQKTRVAILTSSRTHETSVESDEWGHGAFTYFLLEGISGQADNFPADGVVSVTELFDHVIVAVPRATQRAQHPSGKFSYNWPADKNLAVRVGRVKGLVKSRPNTNSQTQSQGQPQQPPANDTPVIGGGSQWQTVVE